MFNSLYFIETMTASIQSKSTSNKLVFADTMISNQKRGSFSNQLVFNWRLHQTDRSVSMTNSLNFNQQLNKLAITRKMSDLLVFDQTISKFDGAVQNLAFTGTMVGSVTKLATNELLFVDSMDATISKVRAIEDTLTFADYMIPIIIQCQEPIPFSKVYLTWEDLVVELPHPNLNNTFGDAYSRIETLLTDGRIFIGEQRYWPKTSTHAVDFNFLPLVVKKNLEHFLEATAGQTVQYQDHNGNLWDMIVTNPDCEFAELRTGFSVALQLEGQRA